MWRGRESGVTLQNIICVKTEVSAFLQDPASLQATLGSRKIISYLETWCINLSFLSFCCNTSWWQNMLFLSKVDPLSLCLLSCRVILCHYTWQALSRTPDSRLIFWFRYVLSSAAEYLFFDLWLMLNYFLYPMSHWVCCEPDFDNISIQPSKILVHLPDL